MQLFCCVVSLVVAVLGSTLLVPLYVFGIVYVVTLVVVEYLVFVLDLFKPFLFLAEHYLEECMDCLHCSDTLALMEMRMGMESLASFLFPVPIALDE
jgi:hypothetical protein